MKKLNHAILFATALSIVPLANINAQSAFNTVPTNLPGVTTSVAPPAGFSAVDASDEELKLYGFPPRPDASDLKARATWERAMRASKTRLTSPKLEMTNIFHGPNRRAKKADAIADSAGNSTGSSYNWSGSVDFSGATSYNYNNSFYYLYTQYVVPVARQAFGSCTGSWDYSSSWIGIDGDGSNDVLQAGSESDAYCSGSTTAAYYSAWVEWYPYGSVRVSNLPVTAGDDMFVEVWNVSPTQGYAYILNYNNNQAVEIGLTPPSGTSLIGNTAEWVVERPGVNGGLANLTNYVIDYFSSCYAYTFAGTQYTPGNSSALQLTMLDNNGNAISYPYLLGNAAIQFNDEGTAR